MVPVTLAVRLGAWKSWVVAAGALAAALGLVLVARLQGHRPPGPRADVPAAARAGAPPHGQVLERPSVGATGGSLAGAAPGGLLGEPGQVPGLPQVAVPVASEVRAEREREAAGRLQEQMGRLVSDLEFTRGQREPLQQTVVKPPDPWTPPVGADALPPPSIELVSPGSAPAAGGVLVTLRGRNLRNPRVVFGTAPARIFGGGADFVTVEVPAARAGQVRVALTNEDGGWVLVGQPFTYLE